MVPGFLHGIQLAAFLRPLPLGPTTALPQSLASDHGHHGPERSGPAAATPRLRGDPTRIRQEFRQPAALVPEVSCQYCSGNFLMGGACEWSWEEVQLLLM